MQIKRSKEMGQGIKRLVAMMDENEARAEAYNDYLSHRNFSIYKVAKKSFQDGLSSKKAFLESTKKYFLPKNGFSLEKESFDAICELNSKIFANNPYYEAIHFGNQKKNGWELRQSSYEPFQGFVYNEIIVKPHSYFKEITPFGFFKERFPYLEILENDKNWMSVTPHEILTMFTPIKEAKGKVLTFGLGMGYYAFMASIKDDVKEVTIVEKDKNAISLFNEFILPQFPNRSKIKIIHEDAFQFASTITDKEYDTIFVDIWHLPLDGLFLYLPFKRIFRDFKETKISYWIEKSILALLRRTLIILIDEEYQKEIKIKYTFADNETDALINSLHYLLQEETIENVHDLFVFLEDDNLKRIAAQLD